MDIYLSNSQFKKKKKINSYSNTNVNLIKINIPAGNASVSPPLGPLLGQNGINSIEFCKEFNEETRLIEKDTDIGVNIYLAYDRTYYFELKTPSVSYLIRKYLESEELLDSPILEEKFFLKMIYNIAFLKLYLYFPHKEKLNISSKFFKSYLNSIIGTSRSFNITII